MSPNKPIDDWFLTLPIKAIERITDIKWNYEKVLPFDYISNAFLWWNVKSEKEKETIMKKEQNRFKNSKNLTLLFHKTY